MLPILMFGICILMAVGGLSLYNSSENGLRNTLAELAVVFGIIGIIVMAFIWSVQYMLTSTALKDAEVTGEKMLLISTRGQTTKSIYDFDKLKIDKKLFDLSNPVHQKLIQEIDKTNIAIRNAQDGKNGPWSMIYPSMDKYPPIIEFTDSKSP